MYNKNKNSVIANIPNLPEPQRTEITVAVSELAFLKVTERLQGRFTEAQITEIEQALAAGSPPEEVARWFSAVPELPEIMDEVLQEIDDDLAAKLNPKTESTDESR